MDNCFSGWRVNNIQLTLTITIAANVTDKNHLITVLKLFVGAAVIAALVGGTAFVPALAHVRKT